MERLRATRRAAAAARAATTTDGQLTTDPGAILEHVASRCRLAIGRAPALALVARPAGCRRCQAARRRTRSGRQEEEVRPVAGVHRDRRQPARAARRRCAAGDGRDRRPALGASPAAGRLARALSRRSPSSGFREENRRLGVPVDDEVWQGDPAVVVESGSDRCGLKARRHWRVVTPWRSQRIHSAFSLSHDQLTSRPAAISFARGSRQRSSRSSSSVRDCVSSFTRRTEIVESPSARPPAS